ncbi:MAG: hypothetical protein H6716_24780 [Polyangiaceae bacterium]|nr:hypothetical protein [Polyangiaceae bacterium]
MARTLSTAYAERTAAEEALRAPTAHLPFSIDIDGVAFSKTGKTGTSLQSGLASCEYADADDRRLWIDAEGNRGEIC